jgi:putative transposase
MTSGEGHTVTFPLHVVCRYAQGRRGKQGIDVLLFAVVGGTWTSTPHRLAEVFSRRFGIESSYTLMNALRIRTSSRDPKLRFLFVVLSFFLINLWTYFQWTFLAIPRRGGRLLDPGLLRLSRFRTFLRCAIRDVRPPVLTVRRPS